MATPPTFVTDYPSAFNTGTQPKTSTPTVATGDVLVVVSVAEGQLSWVAPSGGALTYAAGPALTAATRCAAGSWSTTASGAQSYTLSMGDNSGTLWWGFNALRFSGSAGLGATASATAGGVAAPTLGITTLGDNSAIVVIIGDYDAVSGTSRTWRAVNGTTPTGANTFERTYFTDPSHYTLYVAYYPDAGTAGLKTVGMTAPANQMYSIIAYEVKGATATAASPRAERRVSQAVSRSVNF